MKMNDEWFSNGGGGYCCGSLLPVFGVRVSVIFHLTCVNIIFSSVWVAEWPPFWKQLLTRLTICLYFDYL